MKVCVVGTRGFPNIPGGVEKHCECLYALLTKQGCEVIVFARDTYVGQKEYNYQGIRIIPLKSYKNKFLEAFHHTFISILAAKKHRPDILHIHAVGPSIFTPMARILGLKVVMTHHGPDYMRKKWNALAKAFLKTGEYLGCTTANAVICISRGILKDIKVKYGRQGELIPNGVAIPQLTTKVDALKEFGLTKGKYILAVGRFVPEKGFHDLISAFQSIKLEGWKLVIAGDADHEDEYSRTLKEQAAQTKGVVLTGYLTGDKLQELFTHAGLFVLPSYYEGLPIVLLEALSYGLSVLVSDIEPNQEVNLPKERYFKVGDIASLAERMTYWTKHSFSADEKARQIQMIADNYNWEKIATSTFDIYKKVDV